MLLEFNLKINPFVWYYLKTVNLRRQSLLSELKLPIDKKLEWINQYNDSFKKEFNSDKNLNNQLSKKYRDFKANYFNFINTTEFEEVKNLILLNVKESTTSLSNIVNNQNEIKLKYFFQSIFHMHINRIFTSNQRLFEMIIYDYLWRYYKSLNVLKNYKQSH